MPGTAEQFTTQCYRAGLLHHLLYINVVVNIVGSLSVNIVASVLL